MKNFKSLFLFNRKQQRGIFVLIILLFLVLIIYFIAGNRDRQSLIVEDTSVYQRQVDSLKSLAIAKQNKIYPFNPNYITDYRGYVLGLSEEELGRLHRFRESNKWINSKKDFQNVTGVSDQWLDSISPYFKFPEWVTNPKKQNTYQTSFKKRKVVVKDINVATQEELKAVYGIGPALSQRIIKERDFLKGFIDMKQVRSVYGISDSTMIQLKKHFYINKSSGARIALNTATREELLSVPYFNDYLVDQLIKQRVLREGFKSWDKVVLTSRFPEEKLELIQLYLTLD